MEHGPSLRKDALLRQNSDGRGEASLRLSRPFNNCASGTIQNGRHGLHTSVTALNAIELYT